MINTQRRKNNLQIKIYIYIPRGLIPKEKTRFGPFISLTDPACEYLNKLQTN